MNYLEVCERAGAEGAAMAEALRAVLAGTESTYAQEYPCHSPDTLRWFALRVSRFRGDGGARVIVAHEDVTTVRTAREALQVSEERLRLALEAVRMGTWDYDLRTGIVVRSARTLALLGLAEETYDGPPWQPYHLLVEEDRARVGAAMAAAVREAGAGDGLNVEFRVRRPEGDVRTLRSTGRVHLDDEGVPVRMTGVLLDVTDEKAHEAALIEARDQAEAARAEAEAVARLKGILLDNMSHEIRTPLTSILGFADLLAAETEGEHLDFVRLIKGNGHRLLDTLNSVLDSAQLEAGRYQFDLTELELGVATREAAMRVLFQAEAKGLALQCRLPDEPVRVLADTGALTRIVTHLVSNAVKFTDEGSVTVSVRATPEGMGEVCVQDTGVGITTEFLPRLFDEFRQESEGDDRYFEGLGLGLSISKRLVEMMGGTIVAKSAKGVGSTFTIRIPLVRDGGTQAPDVAGTEGSEGTERSAVVTMRSNVFGAVT